MTTSGISEAAVQSFVAAERERFLARNPKSLALAERARHSLSSGCALRKASNNSTLAGVSGAPIQVSARRQLSSASPAISWRPVRAARRRIPSGRVSSRRTSCLA